MAQNVVSMTLQPAIAGRILYYAQRFTLERLVGASFIRRQRLCKRADIIGWVLYYKPMHVGQGSPTSRGAYATMVHVPVS